MTEQGFTRQKDPRNLPANVRVITLPAYSTERNPLEQLWDTIKDRISNRAWEDINELTEAINSVFAEY